tara:strand:+ start:12195 stop:12881 length:687 start_codon:yes stop_codon:yes gene_type:complete
MKRQLIAAALALGAFVPVNAGVDPLQSNEYKTFHSMGCMMLQECTKDVYEIESLSDIERFYGRSFAELSPDEVQEINGLISASNDAGVQVFLGNGRYFPVNHRGVYHTVENNFFLNDIYMGEGDTLLAVLRHEGWHAAQDCMAGSIDNNNIAIIHMEEEVPFEHKVMAEATYPEQVVPWEQEAAWAGKTPGMTLDAMASCASPTPMWETYEPTPMTREWLEMKGYLRG